MDKDRIGPFVLEERLGVGETGTVYRGVHVQKRQLAAIKLISSRWGANPSALQKLSAAINFLKTLQHPNVVRCFGGGAHEGQAYLAMELLFGESLRELLDRRGRLPAEDVVAYSHAICQALEYVHHRGASHGRLSPEKILLSETGQLKVLDFHRGQLPEEPTDDFLSEHGPTLADLGYLAPEQLDEQPSVGMRSDMYALGCMMFEMLSGRLPFQGSTTYELKQQQRLEPAPRLSQVTMDCPIWLESLVAQMLEKSPSRRPAYFSVVAVALEEAQAKIAAGTSVAQHALSGGPTGLQLPRDASHVRQQVQGQPTNRTPTAPFYERPWFLGICLALLATLVVWVFWPASEAELFAKAEELMATNDRAQWLTARTQYLEPLLQRFPQGEFAAKAQIHLDTIEMEQAEARIKVNQRLGRTPKSTGERLFVEAQRYEAFGDLATAHQRYQAMARELTPDEENGPFVKLARRQIAAIAERPQAMQPLAALLMDKLAQADAMSASSQQAAAREIWRTIVSLYQSDIAVETYVQQAKERLSSNQP